MSADAIPYVDESGSLADPRSHYVAIVAVVVRRVRDVRKIVRNAARSGKRVSLKKRGGYETKWWNADDHLRKRKERIVVGKVVKWRQLADKIKR